MNVSWVVIGTGNDPLPDQRQFIYWTSVKLFLVRFQEQLPNKRAENS